MLSVPDSESGPDLIGCCRTGRSQLLNRNRGHKIGDERRFGGRGSAAQ